MKHSYYINKKFNRLKIVEISKIEKKVMATWICSCGTRGESPLNYIVYGGKGSCGCLKNIGDWSFKKKRFGRSYQSILRSMFI